MVHNFYVKPFSTEHYDSIDSILRAIPCMIDQNTNEMLCKPYTGEKIREALFQMVRQKHLAMVVSRCCSTGVIAIFSG